MKYVIAFLALAASAPALAENLTLVTLTRGGQITCFRDNKVFKIRNVEFQEQFDITALGTKYVVNQTVGPNALTIYSCDHIEISKPN